MIARLMCKVFGHRWRWSGLMDILPMRALYWDQECSRCESRRIIQ